MTTTIPRPMSGKARTELMGRIARLAMAEDQILNAPAVWVNGQVIDTGEVRRRVQNLRLERKHLSQELATRPWENRGREQSDAARLQEGE